MQRYLQSLQRRWVDRSFIKQMPLHLDQPLVSFTFDDAPASAFEQGGNLLAQAHYAGTFYIALSFLNHPDPNARFTHEHLHQALQQGHELACHTYGHTQLSRVSTAEGIQDIQHNQAAIQQVLPGFQFQNFSYPFGAQTRPLKQYLGQQFRSARGIQYGINQRTSDLNNLKAVRLYEQHYSLTLIEQLLDRAIATCGWLIFYTHDVCDQPSDYGCTPQSFSAVIRACQQRQLPVLTINQALDRMIAPIAPSPHFG